MNRIKCTYKAKPFCPQSATCNQLRPAYSHTQNLPSLQRKLQMGQTLKTSASVALALQGADELPAPLSILVNEIDQMVAEEKRNEEKKAKDVGSMVETFYDTHFSDPNQQWTSATFYRAVCEAVEELNEKLGSTQFRVPSISTLEQAYKDHNLGNGRTITKEEFQKVLEQVMIGTGFTGAGGAKDVLFFIFGVPLTSLFIKQRVAPKAIPNDIFIPAVTSATVFLLAKLNKI